MIPHTDVTSLSEAIRMRYPKEGAKQLAEDYGKSYRAIVSAARRLGVRTKDRYERSRQFAISRKVDHFPLDAFRVWSSGMAYCLGYIWADGCLFQTKHGRKALILGCVTEDESILDYFKTATACTKNIIRLKPKYGKPYSRLDITSDSAYNTLHDQHGVLRRKSFQDPAFPDVPPEFLADFLRGYFDGDGSAPRSGRKTSLDFCGSHLFVTGIRDSLVSTISVTPKKVYDMKTRKVSIVTWAAVNDIKKIYDFMYYSDDLFSLARKRNKLYARILLGDGRKRHVKE